MYLKHLEMCVKHLSKHATHNSGSFRCTSYLLYTSYFLYFFDISLLGVDLLMSLKRWAKTEHASDWRSALLHRGAAIPGAHLSVTWCLYFTGHAPLQQVCAPRTTQKNESIRKCKHPMAAQAALGPTIITRVGTWIRHVT